MDSRLRIRKKYLLIQNTAVQYKQALTNATYGKKLAANLAKGETTDMPHQKQCDGSGVKPG
jgi:hypothetical protein